MQEFDAFIYAVVPRQEGKDTDGPFGQDVRIDPAELRLSQGVIIAHIPANINHGISSVDDLQEDWFEAVEAAFLAFIYGCLP